MPLKTNTSLKKKNSSPIPDFIVTDEVGNYEKHPFFVKKANDTKALLAKVGVPKEFAEREKKSG